MLADLAGRWPRPSSTSRGQVSRPAYDPRCYWLPPHKLLPSREALVLWIGLQPLRQVADIWPLRPADNQSNPCGTRFPHSKARAAILRQAEPLWIAIRNRAHQIICMRRPKRSIGDVCHDRPPSVRTSNERPRGRRAAEQRDEVAPLHVCSLKPRLAPYHTVLGKPRCASQQTLAANVSVGS
jgi:hypothetical protein